MKWIAACVALAMLLAAGCTQSSGSADAEQPRAAVAEFLEAARTGDNDRVAAMLTPLARQKTAEMGMQVQLPGSPTARFEVGKVEFVTPSQDGAYVYSVWSDVIDDQGNTRSDEIIWVLRQETEGWRIAGMATKPDPDEPPLVQNFEDPADMVRKQQLLHAEEDQESTELPGQQEPSTTLRSRADSTAR